MSQAGDKAKIDEEYMSLMAELGEGPPPDRSKTGQARQNPNPNYPGLFDRYEISLSPFFFFTINNI